MFLSYYAVFYKENNEFWLKVPDLPGCFSCGEDFITAREMGKKAIELYLDGMDIEKLPLKSSLEDIYETHGELVLLDVEMGVKDGKLCYKSN